MERSSLAIKKYLKKKKELLVVDLRVSNYSKSNFYLGIVYNTNISRYKVIYIPFDLIDDGRIEDYVCYQFIDMMTVDYILKTLIDAKDVYQDDLFRNRVNKLIDNYLVEININVDDHMYAFRTTRFIPKDWVFMFDMIVTIFEYAPNIVGGLCEDLLTLFKDESEDIYYQESFEFDILRDDEAILEDKFGKEILNFEIIDYLEKINSKYFSIICGHIVIVEYDFGVVNVFCNCENYDDYHSYVLTVLMAIRDNREKKFNKLLLLDADRANKGKYYLAYALTSEGIKVIHGCEEIIIPYKSYKQGLIKFIEDVDNLEEAIKLKVK